MQSVDGLRFQLPQRFSENLYMQEMPSVLGLEGLDLQLVCVEGLLVTHTYKH